MVGTAENGVFLLRPPGMWGCQNRKNGFSLLRVLAIFQASLRCGSSRVAIWAEGGLCASSVRIRIRTGNDVPEVSREVACTHRRRNECVARPAAARAVRRRGDAKLSRDVRRVQQRVIDREARHTAGGNTSEDFAHAEVHLRYPRARASDDGCVLIAREGRTAVHGHARYWPLSEAILPKRETV